MMQTSKRRYYIDGRIMIDITRHVDTKDIIKNATLVVHIKGVRRFHFRLWVGVHIMKFGAWITGANCEIGQKWRKDSHV